MGFGTYERKVRDSALGYGRRVNALGGCVQRYSPLGFQVTFAYLRHAAGPFRRDEAALLRAIDVLTASRRLWLAENAAYAERRKAEKRSGRRSPGAAGRRPMNVWHGDERDAALFALEFHLRREAKDRWHGARDADPGVMSLAAYCVGTGGRLDRAAREEVGNLRAEFGRRRGARDSLWILDLIASASPVAE